ncbi:hypothetical protein D3C81_1521120 [compost metagenome]
MCGSNSGPHGRAAPSVRKGSIHAVAGSADRTGRPPRRRRFRRAPGSAGAPPVPCPPSLPGRGSTPDRSRWPAGAQHWVRPPLRASAASWRAPWCGTAVVPGAGRRGAAILPPHAARGPVRGGRSAPSRGQSHSRPAGPATCPPRRRAAPHRASARRDPRCGDRARSRGGCQGVGGESRAGAARARRSPRWGQPIA